MLDLLLLSLSLTSNDCCATNAASGDRLQAINELPNGRLHVTVWVDQRLQELEFQPATVRSSDFRAYASGSGATAQLDTTLPATYSGSLQGQPEAYSVAIYREGILTAFVDRPGLEGDWSIEADAADPSGYRVRRSAAGAGANLSCGHQDHEQAPQVPIGGPPQSPKSTSGLPILKVALDADFEQYLQFGSISATQDHLEALLLLASMIYEKEVGLRLETPLVNVWYNTAHPLYPYDDASCTAPNNAFGTCLAPFWTQSFLPAFGLLSVMTGTNPWLGQGQVAGIAQVDGVCKPLLNGNLQRWNVVGNAGGSLGTRVLVVCHETGHSLGLGHQVQGLPSIMQAGQAGNYIFTADEKTALASKITEIVNTGCIVDFGQALPAPTISSVMPSAVHVHQTETIEIQGTGLNTVTDIRIDGVHFGPNKIEYVSPTLIRCMPGEVLATGLGSKSLELRGAGGTATTSITLLETNPIYFNAAIIDIVVQRFIQLDSRAGAGEIVAYGSALSPNVISFGSWNILAGWSLLAVTNLNSIGFAPTLSVSIPPAMWGIPLFVQAIATDAQGIRESSQVIAL